ncbi:hypothetical protein [Prauserella muralis]|uniref:hypothetical protein n=1 Tax=Prauserella muralis TaxID=588067 RepID=UPI0011AD0834|nr:hypothetical protein FHX69_1993 [Prauserella muralis]
MGETRRVCHVVPVPPGDTVPERLTAYCGQRFRPGQAELLTHITGMPCEACLAVSARDLAPARLLPALP